jgi:ribonuclease HI
LLRYGDHERELKGGDRLTTNNRMELTAAIKVLQSLKRPCTVDLYTDSQYVRGGITTWMAGWKKNGWRTSGRQPVKNQDLWEALDLAAAPHDVRWHWVKGHSGHTENDRADALANEAIDDLLAGVGPS